MNAESGHTLIPLSKLRLSTRNVRKTGGAAIDDLAASIFSHGLLQNLNVSLAKDGEYEVHAGGRRLKALQKLVADGKIDADFPVDCRVVTADQAAEASLAENTMREAMHPADQFEAFKALVVDEKLPESEVAARFGVGTVFVRQRMKLAKVSPKIIADYRAGKTTLDVVEACALTDDIPRQERCYKQAPHSAHYLRQLLTKGEIPAGDKRVKFVGLDAYEAAGGPVHRDMFDQDNAGYVTDVKLLDKLVAEKLETAAEKLRAQGWGWVETGIDLDLWRYNQASTNDKSKTGAVASLQYDGTLKIATGVLRPGQGAEKPAKTGAEGKAKPSKATLSGDMVWRLELHRAAAIREHVAAAPAMALRMVIEQLLAYLGGVKGVNVSSTITAESAHLDDTPLTKFPDLQKSPARQALQDRLDRWMAAAKAHKGDTPAWVSSLTQSHQVELLALLFACTLERNSGKGGAELAHALGVDMAKWWTPSADTFLGIVPKAILAAAVADVAGKAAGEQLLTMKKDGAIAAAAQHLDGKGWLPQPLRGPGYAAGAAAKPSAVRKPVAKFGNSRATPKPKPATKKATPKKAAARPPKAKKATSARRKR